MAQQLQATTNIMTNIRENAKIGLDLLHESFGKRKDTQQGNDVAVEYLNLLYYVLLARLEAYSEKHPEAEPIARKIRREVNDVLNHQSDGLYLATGFYSNNAMAAAVKYKDYFAAHPETDYVKAFFARLQDRPTIKINRTNRDDITNAINLAVDRMQIEQEIEREVGQDKGQKAAAKKSSGCLGAIACFVAVLALLCAL